MESNGQKTNHGQNLEKENEKEIKCDPLMKYLLLIND